MFNEYCVACHGKDAKGTGPAASALPKEPAALSSVLEHIFPSSIVDAMARTDVLQIVVFALLFGAAFFA